MTYIQSPKCTQQMIDCTREKNASTYATGMDFSVRMAWKVQRNESFEMDDRYKLFDGCLYYYINEGVDLIIGWGRGCLTGTG